MAEVCFQYDNGAVIREKFNFGQFSIMLKSKLCNLSGADPQKLVASREEATEMGGYFVLNGLERVVRLLILPKRNYPLSMVRNSFCDRRQGYTDKAVRIRCVREDQSSVSVRVYYLRNGSARLGFWVQGREYLLPVGVVLKALVDTTDREIYVSLTCCCNEKYGKGKGEHFQPDLEGLENKSYSVVADSVLKDYIFVHLDNNYDKFNLLISDFCARQSRFLAKSGGLTTWSPDFHLSQEKLEDWLNKAKKLLQDEINNKGKSFSFCSLGQVEKVMDKNPSKQMSTAVENMLKTGRLVTQTGLDLQQRAGFTVQAERLNYLHFFSHFRAVHRGASFAGLRTTSVRKLLCYHYYIITTTIFNANKLVRICY